MLTIEHKIHNGVQYAVCRDLLKRDWRKEHAYAVGWDKPHYPVPAKIEYVIWEDEYPFFPLLVHDDIGGDCLRYVTDFQP